jgi:hypothetical protein
METLKRLLNPEDLVPGIHMNLETLKALKLSETLKQRNLENVIPKRPNPESLIPKNLKI